MSVYGGGPERRKDGDRKALWGLSAVTRAWLFSGEMGATGAW